MPTHFRPFLITAATSLHPGRGSDVGVVDMPIQRERHTDHPKIEASGIKGCLKDHYREKLDVDGTHSANADGFNVLLGPPNGDDHASAGGFMDARILFFPVRSVSGVFAWVTCRYVLRKFSEAMALADIRITDDAGAELVFEGITDRSTAHDNPDIAMALQTGRKDVVLNDYVFENVSKDATLAKFITWLDVRFSLGRAALLQKHVILVDDSVFSDMVRNYTEMVARVSLDDDMKTVQNGPWYVEYLPEETVLYSLITARKPGIAARTLTMPNAASPQPISLSRGEDILTALTHDALFPNVIQLGAGYTVGKGWARLALYKEPALHAGPAGG